MANHFNIGDLVWAKLHDYPWWPSIVYNEALTSTQVLKSKKEGFVLVSFFGDSSYEWLDPKNLLPFESNYRSLSIRSSTPLFLKAINEAVYEINHRAALGLTCPCLFFSSYRPSRVEGFLEVDINGYSSGGVYLVRQLNAFRQEFEPVQTLSFVRQLALDSTNVKQDLNLSKEVARVLAFRKAKYAEVDEPYFLAFKVDPYNRETALVQAPAEPPSKTETKDQKKPSLKYKNEKKKSLATPKHKPDSTKTNRNVKRNQHDESNIESSEDHVPHKKRHVKVEIEKKRDFISARDNNKQVESSATTKKRDDVKFVEKAKSSDTSKSPKTRHMHTNSPRASKPLKKRCTSPKMPQTLSSQNKRKKEENSIIVKAQLPQEGPKMVLSMKFPPGSSLPSTSELKAKFVIFGRLDVSGVHVNYFKSRCQVVFMNKSDAERAYNHVVNSKPIFGQTIVRYRLHPYISSQGRIKEAKETTVVPQQAHVTSHSASFCQETYGKYQQTDQTQGSVDISEKMLYLLNECSRIVRELKQQ